MKKVLQIYIDSKDDLKKGLRALEDIDPRLKSVMSVAGEIPLRRRPAGFESLCQIIVSQQLSVASAAAVWNRLFAALTEFSPNNFLAHDDVKLRQYGLSQAKIKAITGLAEAECAGFQLAKLDELKPDDARMRLMSLKGIGPWTADVYLMFCIGHRDIFAPGDVALQHAVRMAFDLEEKPDSAQLSKNAEQWSPWRAVAARLFWAYYRARKMGREGLSL